MISFLLILGILSPGISIVYLFSGFYFPNDKLSIIYATSSVLIKGAFNNDVVMKSGLFFFLLSMIFAVRNLFFDISPTVSDINLLVSYTLLPFVALKIGGLSDFMSALRKYGIAAVLWGLCQQILMNLGFESFLYSMFTHPEKVSNYTYDPWAPYMFRVSGFQIESSQYAYLLGFILFLIKTHKIYYSRKFEIMLIFSILINGSTSGFIALIMAQILTQNFKIVGLIKVVTTIVAFSIVLFGSGLLDNQLLKIDQLLAIIDGRAYQVAASYGRISGFIEVLDLVTIDQLWFGIGLEFRGGHDFFSVNTVGIGVLGTLIMFFLFSSFWSPYLLKTIFFFIPYLLSAGSLLEPVYEIGFLYIVVASLDKFAKK